MKNYLAVDLGAESGRVMLGSLSADSLALEELHRFPNNPVRLPSGLYWDAFRLFHEIEQGLAGGGPRAQLSVDGIGVDTWGVDFGLLGRDGRAGGQPAPLPRRAHNGMLERTFAVAPREESSRRPASSSCSSTRLYQLHAIKLAAAAGSRGRGAPAVHARPVYLTGSRARRYPS